MQSVVFQALQTFERKLLAQKKIKGRKAFKSGALEKKWETQNSSFSLQRESNIIYKRREEVYLAPTCSRENVVLTQSFMYTQLNSVLTKQDTNGAEQDFCHIWFHIRN